MRWSTLKDLSLMVLTLVLIPQDSSLLAFLSHDSDWYGESVILGDPVSWVVAKNAGEHPVDLGVSGDIAQMAIHLDQDEAYFPVKPSTVRGKSLALIQVDSSSLKRRDRRADLDGRYYFRPENLRISTPGEDRNSLFLLAFLLAGCVYSGFVLAQYSGDRAEVVNEEG